MRKIKSHHKLQNHWTNLTFTNHNRTGKNSKHTITYPKKVALNVVQKETKLKSVAKAEIKNAITVVS